MFYFASVNVASQAMVYIRNW